jgi:hypothetical protein
VLSREMAMIPDSEYAQAVAEFLSNKGVTRCPTACVVPTRASVSDADRAALRTHQATREEVQRARRREARQMISPPRTTSRDRHAEITGLPVSGPGSEACVSP